MCPRHCRRHSKGRAWVCELGRLRGFVEACAVALLAETPAHGYDLIGRLDRFGLQPDGLDAGTFYRMLRRLESEGLLRSSWSTEGSGAARRVYEVTDEGLDFLRSWRTSAADVQQHLTGFISTLDSVLGEAE